MGTTEEGDAFIRVRDTGPGIPNDDFTTHLSSLFTTKPVGEGTERIEHLPQHYPTIRGQH